MNISESDQAFLARHNFDADVPFSDSSDSVLEEARLKHIRMKAFLEDQYLRGFTTMEMQKTTGLGQMICYLFLRKCLKDNGVEVANTSKDGKITRWKSLLEPPDATKEGLLEEKKLEQEVRDKLGKQARADFFWTLTRGKKKRRQHTHAVRHF